MSHDEIAARMDELMAKPIDLEQMKQLDAFFDSLSPQDQGWAANYGAKRADERLNSIFAKYMGR